MRCKIIKQLIIKHKYLFYKTFMQSIINTLTSFAPLSEAAQKALQQKLSKKTVIPASELLLNQGAVCRHIYFLESGLVRGFYHLKGKEVTSWFAFANEVVTSMYSFVRQCPSLENVAVLEETTLYSLSYNNLQWLYQHYPEFNFIGRLIAEKYYTELEERTLSLQHQTATERYQHLLTHQPNLLQRVSLGQIASYLGISQETLSRVRAKVF